MLDKTVVVFDKTTREMIACISLSGEQTICRKDVGFRIYNGNEPVFIEKGSSITLNENAFVVNLRT